jgi:hypothetical protein
MNSGEISVEHLNDEQNSDVNNEEVKNSTADQLNSEETIKVINEVKVSPKNPTHLYILFVFSSFIIK